MTDRRLSSQVVLEGPRDRQASQDPQAPQVPKASEGYQDSQERMDPQGSRVSQETQDVRDSQDPQGSWGPEDPKVQWASLARMGSQVSPACQGQLGLQETGAFPEKPWEPTLGPREMPACLDSLG